MYAETFEDCCQVCGEENISGLAATVSVQYRPASTCLKIIEVESVESIAFRGDYDDAAWR